MDSYWLATRDERLQQGDLLPDCKIPMIPGDFDSAAEVASIELRVGRLIVVTQSCDLANMKSGLVALCPAYTLPEFAATNPAFGKKEVLEEVRKGRREGLHLLASQSNPSVSREAVLVNFREIFSLPIEYLERYAKSLGERWRLKSPYLEHFSQAFARFFMRVGLPSALPAITD